LDFLSDFVVTFRCSDGRKEGESEQNQRTIFILLATIYTMAPQLDCTVSSLFDHNFNSSSYNQFSPIVTTCYALARSSIFFCNKLEESSTASVISLIAITIIFLTFLLYYFIALSPTSSAVTTSRNSSSVRITARTDASAKIQARRLLSRHRLSRSTIEEDKDSVGFIEFSPRSTDGRANLNLSPHHSTTLLNPPINVIKPLNDLHVLIVDDSETHRRILGRMLERLGSTHTDIEDGEDVFVALVNAAPKIDLILLDVQMAHSNGIVVCNQLKNARLRIPVGAVTSFFSLAEKEKYENAGFAFVLSKPFTQQVLANAMTRALSQH
jgi:CheY-like chemotaxis protein